MEHAIAVLETELGPLIVRGHILLAVIDGHIDLVGEYDTHAAALADAYQVVRDLSRPDD